MKTATSLIPAQLAAFRAEIAPLKGTPGTPENRQRAADIIARHAGLIQLMDLQLSNQEARQLLLAEYLEIA